MIAKWKSQTEVHSNFQSYVIKNFLTIKSCVTGTFIRMNRTERAVQRSHKNGPHYARSIPKKEQIQNYFSNFTIISLHLVIY